MADKENLPAPQADTDGDSKKAAAKKGNEVSKFANHGVAFRAKLIGFEDVPDARGDEMCQKALVSLKGAVLAAKEHKQKIAFKMTLENLEIVDLTTSEILHQHPINKVSFIAKDCSDNRAFGYVVGKGDGKFQFFGIKTEKAAEQVVLTLRDLFTEVFNMKKIAKEKEGDQAPPATDAPKIDAALQPPAVTVSAAPASSVSAPATVNAGVTAAPASAPAPVEPKKSTVDSLIDLDIDWGIGSSQPSNQASTTFTSAAWGAPTSPMTQMGLGGIGAQATAAQGDPFTVSPYVAQQLGSVPPQQQLQTSPFGGVASPYSSLGFGNQNQQQQQTAFSQQQVAPGQQQSQMQAFAQQQPQQPSYGQLGVFSQQQQQQQQSPFSQQPFPQAQLNAGGQMQWPQQQPGQNQPPPFGAAQAANTGTFQQQLFGQAQSPIAGSAQPSLQSPFGSQQYLGTAGFTLQSAASAAPPPAQAQQMFYQQQPVQSAGQSPFGGLQQLQMQPAAQSPFGSQQQTGSTFNPFGSPPPQQQQQPYVNPFGAQQPTPGQAAGMVAPTPAPRINPQQPQPGWSGNSSSFSGMAGIPASRPTDAFADLDILKASTNSQASQPGTGAPNNASFW